jgi:hypothetical protein
MSEASTAVKLSVSFSETDPRTTTPATEISETGAYVLLADRPPLGTVIPICFACLPQEPTLFRARGRVIRHGPDGVGVEFVDLEERQRALIIRIREDAHQMGHRTARSRFRTKRP